MQEIWLIYQEIQLGALGVLGGSFFHYDFAVLLGICKFFASTLVIWALVNRATVSWEFTAFRTIKLLVSLRKARKVLLPSFPY